MNKKKESKVVPNVRFKGFTDDWKQRKLGDVSEIIGGGDHLVQIILNIGMSDSRLCIRPSRNIRSKSMERLKPKKDEPSSAMTKALHKLLPPGISDCSYITCR